MIPRFALMESTTSDDRGPDAVGWLLAIEWFGIIVEWHVYRRGRPL